MRLQSTFFATALCVLSLTACAQTPKDAAAAIPSLEAPAYAPPEPLQLAGETLRVYDAPEADQGVAVDDAYFYPIDNYVIGKYEIATGKLVGRWVGEKGGLIGHLNSCYADAGRLLCANSNYPHAPMGSSVEIFDAETMTHVDSHSLGMTEEGSLTWFADYADGRIVAFAHYDQKGVPFKDHRYSSVTTVDKDWRRTGGWLFPEAIVERMAPHAASGGAIGPDGLLYIMGHDRPEMYVLARPTMGPTLVHVATIAVEAEGQAFAFAPGEERIVYVIDRRKFLVRQVRLPEVPLERKDARRF